MMRCCRHDVLLGVVYFFCICKFFVQLDGFETASAGASEGNLEWQLQQQLTRSTKEEVGRKGPMRIDELGN